MTTWQEFPIRELIEDHLPEYVVGWAETWCGREPHDIYNGWCNHPLANQYQITQCQETYEVGTHGGCSYCLMSKVRFERTLTPCLTKTPETCTGGAGIRVCNTPIGMSPCPDACPPATPYQSTIIEEPVVVPEVEAPVYSTQEVIEQITPKETVVVAQEKNDLMWLFALLFGVGAIVYIWKDKV